MSPKEPKDRKLNTNMIAFERSVQISEALIFGHAQNAEGKVVKIPVPVVDKGVRGQTANDFKSFKDGEKQNAGKSNPQVVEHACVPPGCDAFEISFGVRVLGKSLAPSACDNKDVHADHVALLADYAQLGGFRVLAERFVWNIANGRFAWRNRYTSDDSMVRVSFEGKEIAFNCVINGEEVLGLDAVSSEADMLKAVGEASGNADAVLTELIDRFAEALEGKKPLALHVSWVGIAHEGDEIFPSQEYLGTDADKKTTKSRVYAKISRTHEGRVIPQASVHSQKIGAALRWFDDWHGVSGTGPVPVNPYSGIQETGDVLRWGAGKERPRHFYEIRTNAEKMFSDLHEGTLSGETHFFVANLVRGGVFGSAKEKA